MILQNNKEKRKLAILASGRGSNAINIIDYIQAHCDHLAVQILICDKEEAQVLLRANKLGIKTKVSKLNENKNILFKERKRSQEDEVIKTLKEHGVEWVLLAGYMKILSPVFLDSFYDEKLKHSKVINIHPSLLPKYKGLDAYKNAFLSDDKESGATIHFVDNGMDTGKIIMQKTFQKVKGETFTNFEENGLAIEHELFREFLELLNDKNGRII